MKPRKQPPPMPLSNGEEVCTLCASWVCSGCNWKREHADPRKKQVCHYCGGTLGEFRPVRHSSWRRYGHNPQNRA